MKKALLQMHGAVLLWGFTGILGLAITVDAPVLVWYRTLFTAIIMAGILFYNRQWANISRKDMGQIILVGALIGLHWVAFYGAVKFTNASIALVCLATASIFTSILDPLFNKGKYNFIEILLGLIALVGIYFIYRTNLVLPGRTPEQTMKGVVMGVVAALLSALFTVLNKRMAHKYQARTLVFYEMTAAWLMVSATVAVLLACGQERFLASPSNATGEMALIPNNFTEWILLIVLSLCCTVWAQTLALNALKYLSSFTVTFTTNLEPVYGVILAFIFYHEQKQLHFGFFIGLALILLSVFLQMIRLLKPSLSPGLLKEKGGLD